MNITFFIGNGFDINLGLQTKYSDFYTYFIDNASPDNMIKNWISKDIKLWADLEEKLGEELKHLDAQNVEQFYEDKDELDLLLIDYLEKEQSKISTKESEDSIYETMKNSLNTITNNLSSFEKSSIETTLSAYSNEYYSYEFISFNYTNVLDRIVSICKSKNPIIGSHTYGSVTKAHQIGAVKHIHGTTDAEMILGVNDPSQIHNEQLKKNVLFLNTIVKPHMNLMIGQQKEDGVKKVIESSHIICIFGMSIGNTDKIWWNRIMHWLSSNENNKLILFYKGFEDNLRKKIPGKIIRLSDQLKTNMINQGNLKLDTPNALARLKSRIMISFNSDIFTFPDLIKK